MTRYRRLTPYVEYVKDVNGEDTEGAATVLQDTRDALNTDDLSTIYALDEEEVIERPESPNEIVLVADYVHGMVFAQHYHGLRTEDDGVYVLEEEVEER